MHGLSHNTGFSLWGNQNVYKTGNYWRMLSLYWMAFCTAHKECEGRLGFAIPFSFYHGFRRLHGWTMFIDVEHPHLRLSLKMKLSWCPAGGKVKRRCSRNHRVGKSASVLVALWLFKSSFPLVGFYDFMSIVQRSADHWIFIFHMWSTIGQQEQEMRPLEN